MDPSFPNFAIKFLLQLQVRPSRGGASTKKLVEHRGQVTDHDVQSRREAGYNDGEISEIVANVALNLFTNYFNHVTDPDIDFPVAPELANA